ncbi:MAG TPA: hypothetical protein VJY33_13620, partial [Isosphaeraceae bacterium]|nr:hypothetical protein [Isosphaeraceae bacterium]
MTTRLLRALLRSLGESSAISALESFFLACREESRRFVEDSCQKKQEITTSVYKGTAKIVTVGEKALEAFHWL